jgi:BRCT domain type II-containing protein
MLVNKKLCRSGWASALGENIARKILARIFHLDDAVSSSPTKPTKSKKRALEQADATTDAATNGEADDGVVVDDDNDAEPPAKRQKTNEVEVENNIDMNGEEGAPASSPEPAEPFSPSAALAELESPLYVHRLGRFSKIAPGFTIRYFEDAVEQDRYLFHSADLMRRVHSRFYKERDSKSKKSKVANTSRILPSLRRKILQGVKILFSGIFPTTVKPRGHHLWIDAEEFGATCTTEFTSDVTHVVAGIEGTDKCVEASKRDGVFLVHRDWLEASMWEYKRANEYDFPIGKYAVCKSPPQMPAVVDDESSDDGVNEDADAEGGNEEIPEFLDDNYEPSWSDEKSGEDEDGDDKVSDQEEIRDKQEEGEEELDESQPDHVTELSEVEAPDVESELVETKVPDDEAELDELV